MERDSPQQATLTLAHTAPFKPCISLLESHFAKLIKAGQRSRKQSLPHSALFHGKKKNRLTEKKKKVWLCPFTEVTSPSRGPSLGPLTAAKARAQRADILLRLWGCFPQEKERAAENQVALQSASLHITHLLIASLGHPSPSHSLLEPADPVQVYPNPWERQQGSFHNLAIALHNARVDIIWWLGLGSAVC